MDMVKHIVSWWCKNG